MFFFPVSRLERIEKVSFHLKAMGIVEEEKQGEAFEKLKQSVEPKEDFNSKCAEYFGLGFIASFFPGTRAYEARKVLSEKVDDELTKIKELVERLSSEDGQWFFYKSFTAYLEGGVGNWIQLGPLWTALAFSWRILEGRSNLRSWLDVVSAFPLWAWVFQGTAVARGKSDNKLTYFSIFFINLKILFHLVCNPVSWIFQTMNFAYLFINQVLSIGSTSEEDSAFRKVLKLGNAAIFSIVNIPIFILLEIADIPYQILTNFIFSPIEFIVTSFYRTCTKPCAQEQSQHVEEEGQGHHVLTPSQRMHAVVGGLREGDLRAQRGRSDSVSSTASFSSRSSAESVYSVDEATATVSSELPARKRSAS